MKLSLQLIKWVSALSAHIGGCKVGAKYEALVIRGQGHVLDSVCLVIGKGRFRINNFYSRIKAI